MRVEDRMSCGRRAEYLCVEYIYIYTFICTFISYVKGTEYIYKSFVKKSEVHFR